MRLTGYDRALVFRTTEGTRVNIDLGSVRGLQTNASLESDPSLRVGSFVDASLAPAPRVVRQRQREPQSPPQLDVPLGQVAERAWRAVTS